MKLTSMTLTDMSEVCNGPRLLIVESDSNALMHHAYMLINNKFRVTYDGKASSGMSRILNGDTYDCILVDVDKSERVMVDFLRQCLRRLPEAFVIVMGSNDIRRWICKDEDYKKSSFLPKPCGVKEIHDLLKHIFKGWMVVEEDTSCENLLQENQVHNLSGTLFKSSAPLKTTMIRNNIPFRNDAYQGPYINYLEQALRSKPVAYVDLASDDDESSLKKSTCRRTEKLLAKEKKTMEQKSKRYEPYEYESRIKKKNEVKTRTAWTSELQNKFNETLIEFDKKKAYQSPSLKQKNMSAGLTYNHTPSYLQDHKERGNNVNNPSVVTWMQESSNFQAESSGCKRFGLSTPYENDSSILEARCPQKQPLNTAGASFMSLENIKAKLCKAPPFSLPQQTMTPVYNASGYIPQSPLFEASANSGFGLVEIPLAGTGQQLETQTIQAGFELEPLVTDGNFSQPAVEEEMAPSVVDALGESQLDLGITDTYNYSNGFDDANYATTGGMINVSESLAPIDRFGFLVETSVTGGGGRTEASSNDGLEDLTFPDGRENLFDDVDSNSETLTLGHQNPSLSNPSILAEGSNTEADIQLPINSILPYEGSEGRVMDEDWYTHLIHQDQNVYTEDIIIDDFFQHLMNGSW